jgi:hypothetical protein
MLVDSSQFCGNQSIYFYRVRAPKYEDPSWRLRQGSELAPGKLPLMLQGFDFLEMPELDKDDLSSMMRHDIMHIRIDSLMSSLICFCVNIGHRFQDTKAYRRHKFYTGDNLPPSSKGAKYDHDPHEVRIFMNHN